MCARSERGGRGGEAGRGGIVEAAAVAFPIPLVRSVCSFSVSFSLFGCCGLYDFGLPSRLLRGLPRQALHGDGAGRTRAGE